MELKCSSCGMEIETLPLSCAHSIMFNEETNLWECEMEDCGYISIKEFLCINCCKEKGKNKC